MNKSKVLGLVLAATSVVSLSGCVIAVGNDDWDGSDHWSDVEERNRAHLEKVTVGMTQEMVFGIMGTADFNEMYERKEKSVQLLYYRTQHRNSDGETTKDECTPLVLVDGVVVGWGEMAVQQAMQS